MKVETVKHENGHEEKVVTISESEFRELSGEASYRICEKDKKLFEKTGDEMDPGVVLMNMVVSAKLSAELHNMMFSDKTEETNESEDKE